MRGNADQVYMDGMKMLVVLDELVRIELIDPQGSTRYPK